MSGAAPAPRFVMDFYNGWSPEERRATLPLQHAALREGRMARPTICSICASGTSVWLHDEDYGQPLSAYPVCRTCHGVLHGRFDNPAAWQVLVARYGGAGQWFNRLSLDPACRYRPFRETYPDGLPASVSKGATIEDAVQR